MAALNESEVNEAVKRAIDAAGSGVSLAEKIGRSPQFVSQMLNRDRDVPAELCPVIERETGVRCEDLRPDVAWGVVRSGSAEAASNELAPGATSRAETPECAA